MLDRPLSLPQSTHRALLDRVRLSEFLPYLVYDEDMGLYMMEDGTVGFIIEMLPRVYASETTASTLESMLSTLPSYSSVQVLAYGSPYLDPVINRWRNLDVGNSSLLTVWKERYAEFMKARTVSQVTPVMKARIRDIRVFVSIKMSKGQTKKSFLKKGPMHSLSNVFSDQYEQAQEAKSRVQGSLQTGNFDFWDVTPDMLVRLLYEILNPNHDLSVMPTYDTAMPIKRQVLAYDTMVNIGDNCVEMDGVRYGSLSVKEYPQQFHLAYMGELLGDYFFNEAQFSSTFMVCYNAVKLPSEYHSDLKKRASVILLQKFPESIFPKLVMKQADLRDGMEKIERSEPLLFSSLNVMITGRSEKDLAVNSERAMSFWRSKKFTLMPDKFIVLPVFLSCLPLCFDQDVEKNLGRSRLWFSDTAASFFPIEGDWKGSKTPAIPLVSRRGQIIAFDIFDSPTNFGSYIIATSGSGKSFFVNYMTTNYLALGARIFILDIGRSYKKLCDIFGGQWLEFDPQNPVSMNPFSTLENTDDLQEFMDYLINLVFFMGSPVSQRLSEEIEKLVKTYLEQAITACYSSMGKDMLIDHIIEALREIGKGDGRVQDFAVQLEPYSTRGRFGRFFAGKSEIDFTSSLVVVENDRLENIPELRDPVMMITTYHISRNIYMQKKGSGARYAKNIVFIDEAHKFLGNPKIDLFIEQAYRRFRKHGAGICIITQGFNDLYVPNDQGINTSRAGRVIIENSAFKFFLLQTPESLQTLKISRQIPLQEFEFDMLASIRPVKGQYSEIFVSTPWGLNTIARYVPDKFSYYLYTTDKHDKDRVERKVAEGKDIIGAIEAVVAEDIEKEEISAKMVSRA